MRIPIFIILIAFTFIINAQTTSLTELKVKTDNTTQTPELTLDTNKIHTVVDKMPTFPGGEVALMIFIGKNLRYPQLLAFDHMLPGKVIIRFIVRKNGSISNIEILRKLDTYQDNEAVRLVKSLPNFIPAELNGQKVDANFILPIYFRLQ